MSRKFLPLSTPHTYLKDPKRIRTFVTRSGDNISVAKRLCFDKTDPRCQKIEKKKTKPSIEDEIFKFYEGRMAKQSFNKDRRKPKCKKLEAFTQCVLTQRSPSDLKLHAKARESYLRTKKDLSRSWHNAKIHLRSGKKLIRLESPKLGDSNIKPKVVDSVNSLNTYYVPTRKLLDIKKPRSGIYINQPPIKFDTKLPYETYNPRIIQKKIEDKNIERYDLLPQDADGLYAWVDITQDLNELFFKDPNAESRPVRSIECIDYEPKFFTIPCDTDKTFKASIIFGKSSVKPDVIIENDFLNDTIINERRRKEIACCYATFIESYVSNPETWSAPKLSEIFSMGIEHWKKSNELDYIDRCGDFDIIPEITEKYATVEMKIFIQGKLYDNPNILKNLYLFFSQYPACVFVTRDTYLLIWKRCRDTFYIFDPNGRDKTGKRDHENGKCSLISTVLEEHVVHLILNLGMAQPDDEYVIYEICFKNFGFIPNPIDQFPKIKRKKLYAIVNKFYALVPATVGVEPPEESIEENSSLMISFISLLYSQIDPPKYWTISIVDSLIKAGGQRYVQFVRENKLETLDINNLPNTLTFGTYKTHLIKYPIVKSGHISDCTLYRNSLLTHSIIDFFGMGYEIGLLQVDNSTMGLWKDQIFYYVFDPFKRGKAGQVINLEEDDASSGVGCLQIHINLDSLCRIVNKNALDMKSTGTFFIHGIRILSVQLLSTHHSLFNRGEFIGLNIRYPFPSKLNKYESCEDYAVKTRNALDIIPLNCLSNLSVSPCERACSESSFMELQDIEKSRQRKMEQIKRLYSIETIPDADRISDYDSGDVVDGVIKDFICDLMTTIKRKTEKRVKTPIEAEKILLKSDRGYLEETLRRLKCGQDFDNVCKTFSKIPPCEKMPTLEEEIAVPSNFITMPDGNWAVFGNEIIELTKEKLPFALLSALSALLLMNKYYIHTWNSAIVDFVAEVATTLKAYYDVPERALEAIMRKKIPEIQIGKFHFQIVKKKTTDSMAMELKTVLEDMLTVSKKILIVYNTFSCAVFQPGHLFYLYMAFPSDPVGFRTAGSGPTALIRLLDLDALVQRIEMSRFCMNETQPFVMIAVDVRRVSKDKLPIYYPRGDSDEEITIQNELTIKAKADKRLAAKMAFINDEIRKEKKRIRDFLREKKRRLNKGDDMEEYEGEGEMEEEVEDEDYYEPKHKPGRILSNMDTYDDPLFVKPDPGYKLTEEECMFKIQGTMSLDNRAASGATKIKTCYVAAVYAILNTILTPVHKWDARRIDKIIESAKEMDLRIKDRNNMCSRIIKNMRVDDYIFNVIVKVIEFWHPSALIDYYIDIVSQTRSFYIIQITNACFAVYKDEYYHLFDPYATLDKIKAEDEEEEEDKDKDFVCPDSIYKVSDKNTASWILFAAIDDLFDYIDKRASVPEWRSKNKILVVDVLSFKQASRKERMSYYAYEDVDCTGLSGKYEDISCLKIEKVSWLENPTKLVPWSRLNRKDHKQYLHGKPTNKDKAYEIEVPNKVFSLWGTIHPLSAVFRKTKGKQYLACNVLACCMASVFKVTEWNSKVVDSIVINGDKYFKQSIEDILRKEHEFSIEDLNLEFRMDFLNFKIHLESVVFGRIYSRRKKEFNMASALGYFFERHRFGVVQSLGHSIAIGRGNVGYFMFDCQTHGLPIFQKDQGTAYVLRTNTLQTLLYCLVMTFGIPYYNIEFIIHKVEMSTVKITDDGEEEEEEEQ